MYTLSVLVQVLEHNRALLRDFAALGFVDTIRTTKPCNPASMFGYNGRGGNRV